MLKHCEMLSKAVISTFGKTKDHGKLLAICFLQKTLTVFGRPFLLQFPGKLRTRERKKKEIAPPSRHFPRSILLSAMALDQSAR